MRGRLHASPGTGIMAKSSPGGSAPAPIEAGSLGSVPQAKRASTQELVERDHGCKVPAATDPQERDLPQERGLESVLLAMCK